MIRGIVAIDSKNGMADDKGIPWDLPSDKQYFRDHIQTGQVLMGYGTYTELQKPFGLNDNFVATSRDEGLRAGFIKINDAIEFLNESEDDVWNIGGVGLLSSTIDLLDELYITQLEGDFHCTKFLPNFTDKFSLVSESSQQNENGINFSYQIWQRNRLNSTNKR